MQPTVETFERRQRLREVPVGKAKAAHAEAARGDVDVNGVDRNVAAGGGLDGGDDELTRDVREEINGGGARHDDGERKRSDEGEPDNATAGHEGSLPRACHSPILGRMDTTYDLPTLRRAARLAGFEWTDAELESILPAVEATRALLAALETLPVAEVEAAARYTAI